MARNDDQIDISQVRVHDDERTPVEIGGKKRKRLRLDWTRIQKWKEDRSWCSFSEDGQRVTLQWNRLRNWGAGNPANLHARLWTVRDNVARFVTDLPASKSVTTLTLPADDVADEGETFALIIGGGWKGEGMSARRTPAWKATRPESGKELRAIREDFELSAMSSIWSLLLMD